MHRLKQLSITLRMERGGHREEDGWYIVTHKGLSLALMGPLMAPE